MENDCPMILYWGNKVAIGITHNLVQHESRNMLTKTFFVQSNH